MEKINRKLGLKVKCKHLAQEVRIIRFEEKRTYGSTRDWLHHHRIHVVRPEARATQIAYAFAKGTALRAVERYPEQIPTEVWSRVVKMVNKYSDKSNKEFIDWITEADVAIHGYNLMRAIAA